jgi:hypothetical protein
VARSVAGLRAGKAAHAVAVATEAGIGVALLVFAGATLAVQARRRRRLPDATFTLFRIGIAGLVCAVAAHLLGALGVLRGDVPALVAGAAWVFAFVLPVVVGMLYKIVPFLVWFHLQGENTARIRSGLPPLPLPTMRDAIPARFARVQLAVCGVAIPLIVAAPLAPPRVARLGSVALLAVFALLEVALLAGWRTFRSRRSRNVSARREGDRRRSANHGG